MPDPTGYKSDRNGLYIEKDVNATLDYSIDWSDWMPVGAVITNSSWTVGVDADDTTPLTLSSPTRSGVVTSTLASGGTPNKVYRVYNTITLDTGLIERRSFRILAVEKEV